MEPTTAPASTMSIEAQCLVEAHRRYLKARRLGLPWTAEDADLCICDQASAANEAAWSLLEKKFGVMESTKNYTVTIAYGSDKNRHHGKYTALDTTRTEAIAKANAYFAKRNRTNRQVTNVQEWENIK